MRDERGGHVAAVAAVPAEVERASCENFTTSVAVRLSMQTPCFCQYL